MPRIPKRTTYFTSVAVGSLLLLTALLFGGPTVTAANSTIDAAAASLLVSSPITTTGGTNSLFLPNVHGPRPTVPPRAPAPTATTAPPPSNLEWDSRLSQRGAELRPVAVLPGNGYWRLVQAVWYDEGQAQGKHHIFIDALDPEGRRVAGVPFRIYWNGGSATVTTQAKPGEAYAADFGMFSVAPAYGAIPNDTNPADDVWGMGLGSVEAPYHSIHTSYGLTWQWTVASDQNPAPTPTPEPQPTSPPTAQPTDPATPEPQPTDPATPEPQPTDPATPEPTPTQPPLPSPTPSPQPTATTAPPPSNLEWDSRLSQRGAELRPVAVLPGNGYWRLVRAVWYDEAQAQGKHHIFIDALDPEGRRVAGVPFRIYWSGGSATVTTQAKPGEAYAADFGMFSVAPAYGAIPDDTNPADDVWGMGLGSVEAPYHSIHTSYGLTWQWTIAPDHNPAPTPTPEPQPTSPPTAQPTDPATPEPTPTQPPQPSPTSSPQPTPESSYEFASARLLHCSPNAGVTYVEGTVKRDGVPVNGNRVVFSWERDGQIVAGIHAGPHAGYPGWNPGYFSHIIQAGTARQGDWWFWIVDDFNVRISEVVHVRTDGVAGEGSCQAAVVEFDSK